MPMGGPAGGLDNTHKRNRRDGAVQDANVRHADQTARAALRAHESPPVCKNVIKKPHARPSAGSDRKSADRREADAGLQRRNGPSCPHRRRESGVGWFKQPLSAAASGSRQLLIIEELPRVACTAKTRFNDHKPTAATRGPNVTSVNLSLEFHQRLATMVLIRAWQPKKCCGGELPTGW